METKIENRRLFRSISEDPKRENQYHHIQLGVINIPAPQTTGGRAGHEALRRRKISTPRGIFAPETIEEIVIT